MDILKKCIAEISASLDADIYVYSGEISRKHAWALQKLIRSTVERKDNACLFLTTFGGDPDAAYLIAKAMKAHYKKFTLFVFGVCKSAGTLVALGADEIVMARTGEFGPLDIQIAKEDELGSESGLIYLQAMVSLKSTAFQLFEDFFLKIKGSSNNTIRTKTAGEIATNLTIGLLSPVSGQIDPIRMGDVQRALDIVKQYGERLTTAHSKNRVALDTLITDYPSHGFVIDFEEAKSLFQVVREPTEEELQLLESSIAEFVFLRPAEPTIIEFCKYDILQEKEERDETESQSNPADHEAPDRENLGGVREDFQGGAGPADGGASEREEDGHGGGNALGKVADVPSVKRKRGKK